MEPHPGKIKDIGNIKQIFVFHGEVPFYIETSALIYSQNQGTGLSMIGTSIMEVNSSMMEVPI